MENYKFRGIMTIQMTLELQQKAKHRIPGLTQLLSKRPDMYSDGVWPAYFSRAKGAAVWDLDGNEYLDMSLGGIGATVLGYADDEVDDAVMRVVRNGVASTLNCPEEVQLAETLCELHPWAEMARFSRSGGEIMTMAVRIARAATGRDVVAFCGYHGWHDWYLAANLAQENALEGHLLPGLPPRGVPAALRGTAFPFHYNKLHELENIVKQHGSRLAAIVMEPLRSNRPEPGFLEGVRALADECGAVLVFDEVSSGFRYSAAGAHMTITDVRPDLAGFAKALGNGYAIAALIGRAGVMEAAQSTFISSTNWTERLGFAAALATLAKHRRCNVGEHLVSIGREVQDGVNSLAAKHALPLHSGGMEPMTHISFDANPAEAKALFIQLMLEDGILATNSFYAMYTHSRKDVERYLASCDKAFAFMAAKRDWGSLLKGRPSQSGFVRLA